MKLFDRIRLRGRSDRPSIVADSLVSDRWLFTTVNGGDTAIYTYTINPDMRTEDHSGRIYLAAHKAGGGRSLTFILPTPTEALKGYHYKFVMLTNTDTKIQCTNKIVTYNDIAANSVQLATTGKIIGAEIVAWCDGTYWFVTVRGETMATAGAGDKNYPITINT
jgi:hypothetical protein